MENISENDNNEKLNDNNHIPKNVQTEIPSNVNLSPTEQKGKIKVSELIEEEVANYDDDNEDEWKTITDTDEDNGPAFLQDEEIEQEVAVLQQIDNSILKFIYHEDSVYCIDRHPLIPNVVASGGGDDRAFVWMIDSQNSKAVSLFELKGHEESVNRIQFNENGSLLATADLNGITKVWSLTTTGDNDDSDSKNNNNKRNLYINSCTLLHSLDGPSEAVEWLQWHPKGNVLLVGSEDSTIWMYNGEIGKFMNVFSGHSASVTCGSFTSNGHRIISGSDDCTVKVWNPVSAECTFTFTEVLLGKSPIICLKSKPDDPLVFMVGTAAGAFHIGSVKQNKILSSVLDAHLGGTVEGVEYSEKLQCFISHGSEGLLKIWDANTLRLKNTMKHEDCVVKVQVLGNILFSCSSDNTAAMWDLRNGNLIKSFKGHINSILDFALTCDSKYIVTASDDGTCRVFEI